MLDNSQSLALPIFRRSSTDNTNNNININQNHNSEIPSSQAEYGLFDHAHSQVIGTQDHDDFFSSNNQDFYQAPSISNNHGEATLDSHSIFPMTCLRPEDELQQRQAIGGFKQYDKYQPAETISDKTSYSDSTQISGNLNYYNYPQSRQQLLFQAPRQQNQLNQQNEQEYPPQNYYRKMNLQQHQQQQQQQQILQRQEYEQSSMRQPFLVMPKCGSYLCALKHQQRYQQMQQQQQVQNIDYYNVFEQQSLHGNRPPISFQEQNQFRMQQQLIQQQPQPEQLFKPQPSKLELQQPYLEQQPAEIHFHEDHFTLPLHQPVNDRLTDFFPANQIQSSLCDLPQINAPNFFQGEVQHKTPVNEPPKQLPVQLTPKKYPILTISRSNSIKIGVTNSNNCLDQDKEDNNQKSTLKPDSSESQKGTPAFSSSHTLPRLQTIQAPPLDLCEEFTQQNNIGNSNEEVVLEEIAEHPEFYTAERKIEVTCQMQKSNKKNVVRNVMRTFKQYFIAKQSSDQIMNTFFQGQSVKDVQQKFKRYFSQRKFNHQAIKQLVQHEKYGEVFHQFLKAHSNAFLKTTQHKSQDLPQTFIDFLLLCYWDVDLLDSLETYSKIKNPFQ